MFCVSTVDNNSTELQELIKELDAFQQALYPAESNHLLDLSAINDERIHCIVIRDSNGKAAGCGAIFLHNNDFGEIKRVFIRPEFRGQQLGEKIITCLESMALDIHCYLLRLETGIYQHSAIKLYQRCGYNTCEAFPPYSDDPLSIFMEKKLIPVSRSPIQR